MRKLQDKIVTEKNHLMTSDSDVSQASQPRVTVFMPAYNAEDYLRDAIDSVLCQTYRDFEFLIINDGSNDNTPHILNSYAWDKRVRVITQDQNQGQPKTRNNGVVLAKGEYIALVDADDMCVSHRLERQVAFLDEHPDIDGVGSWKLIVNMTGRDQAATGKVQKLPLTNEEIASRFIGHCPLQHPTMLLRTAKLAAYKYDEDFGAAQDYELWVRMADACRFANIAEPLVCYRRHAGQISTSGHLRQAESAREVQAKQLKALGLDFEQQDLRRHWCLFRALNRQEVPRQTGVPLSKPYVVWARDWLERLREANEEHQIYPEPEFTELLGIRWFSVCRKASRIVVDPRIWVIFFQSNLSRAAFGKMKRFFTS